VYLSITIKAPICLLARTVTARIISSKYNSKPAIFEPLFIRGSPSKANAFLTSG